MIIQFCGLSGSGKTTLARAIKELLAEKNVPVEIIDGDEYRKELCADLGFSREDRNTNIRRLAFVASKLSKFNIVAIICAINPYESIREEVRNKYENVKTVFIDCSMNELIKRDTKGLYKKALLPATDPEKVHNLTGVNDPFDLPLNPDLVIHSDMERADESAQKLVDFILSNYQRS